LGGAQGDAARDRLQQGDVDVDVGGHPAAAFGGGRHQVGLVGQDRGGGVQAGAGDLVDAGAVPAAQHVRDLHRVPRTQGDGA